jgi:hypothetical protein
MGEIEMADLAATGQVENIYKLSTALGLDVEKHSVDALLDQGRALAFSKSHAEVTIVQNGDAVSRSTLDGVNQPPMEVKFSDAKLPLMAVLGGHPSKEYDASVVGARTPEDAHLKFSMSIFGSDVKFHVTTKDADPKIIDGTCKTKDGITTIEETIKDNNNKLLATGHVVTDIGKNPNAFHRTTELKDAREQKLGIIEQDVKLTDNTLIADTSITR